MNSRHNDSFIDSRLLPRPGLRLGPRPERSEPHPPWWADLAAAGAARLLRLRAPLNDARLLQVLQAADDHVERQLAQGVSMPALGLTLGEALIRHGFTLEAVAPAQALAVRALTAKLGLTPYGSQRCAAFHLLQSCLVELDTGEGKTVALLLAAAVAGLAGVPTHVITANEALAVRDAVRAAAVMRALGLTAAAVTSPMDQDERREAYACDVVYTTPQQVGFDYLRDARAPEGHQVLRGLCLGLLDEADSVLLDHARMPLVLAQEVAPRWHGDLLARGWSLALTLEAGPDFHLDDTRKRVTLTPACEQRLTEMFDGCRGGVQDRRVLAQVLEVSLLARHALHRDVDYLVRDEAVELIDRTTGRVLPDTRLSHGLHSAVCIKEQVPPPKDTRHAGDISIHQLMARYCRVGGISGTLLESRAQLWWFHRLTVRRVQPRHPSQRRHAGSRVLLHTDAQAAAVAAAVQQARRAGRPVLVGTDTVAAAEFLSLALNGAGIEHALLTARDEAAEAHLVARAGQPGAVTVSTHLAGRGTDIVLAADSLAAGGLHVVCCTCQGSARIERQLYGRAARNGQPGSSEAILCLADRGFARSLPSGLSGLARRFARADGSLPHLLGRVLVGLVNLHFEASDALQRHSVLQAEKQHRDRLPYGLPTD